MVQMGPLFHTGQAQPAFFLSLVGIESYAVIADSQVNGAIFPRQGNIHRGGLGMSGNVSQTFLDNPVSTEGNILGELRRYALGLIIYPDAIALGPDGAL